MKYVIIYDDRRVNKTNLTFKVEAGDWNEAVEKFYTWVLQSEGWLSLPADLKGLEYYAESEIGVELTAVKRD
jgi:hypothetical protein